MTVFIKDSDCLVSTLPCGEYTLLDTEFTSWKGSLQRNWSLPHEYREIVNIGLLRISIDEKQISIGTGLDLYISPRFVLRLSSYFVELTGITQHFLEDKPPLSSVWPEVYSFIGDSTPLSNGNDGQIIRENLFLNQISSPPFYTQNIRPLLLQGLNIVNSQCVSSSLMNFLPLSFNAWLGDMKDGSHTGLFDCYMISAALSYIYSKGMILP